MARTLAGRQARAERGVASQPASRPTPRARQGAPAGTPAFLQGPAAAGIVQRSPDPAGRLTLLDPSVPAPRLVRLEDNIYLTVYFSQGSYFLDSRGLGAVMTLGQELKREADLTVAVEGHASTEGKADFNLELSKKRRELVVALLGSDLDFKPTFGGTAHGEASPAVAEKGWGKTLEKARGQNRRVEIFVVKKPWSISPDPDPDEPPTTTVPTIPRLTFEDYVRLFPPETPSERATRRLNEPAVKPAERPKASFAKQADRLLDRGLDRILRPILKDKEKRDWVRGKLKDGIKAGGKKAMESVVDTLDHDAATRNAIKKSLEAAWKQEL